MNNTPFFNKHHYLRILIISGFILITILILSACEKKTIDFGSGEQLYNPNAPVDSVRFSTEIIPIFNTNCISCHDVGATSPDLSPANAYNSLTSTPGQYINLANPTSSILYTCITETPNTHGGGLFADEGARILLWIQQGAKNN